MAEFRRGGPKRLNAWLGACNAHGADTDLNLAMYDAVVPSGAEAHVVQWSGEGPLPDARQGTFGGVGGACVARNTETAHHLIATAAWALGPDGAFVLADIAGGSGVPGMNAAQEALDELAEVGLFKQVVRSVMDSNGTSVVVLTAQRTATPLKSAHVPMTTAPEAGRRVQHVHAAASPSGRSDFPSRLVTSLTDSFGVTHYECAKTKLCDPAVYCLVAELPATFMPLAPPQLQAVYAGASIAAGSRTHDDHIVGSGAGCRRFAELLQPYHDTHERLQHCARLVLFDFGDLDDNQTAALWRSLFGSPDRRSLPQVRPPLRLLPARAALTPTPTTAAAVEVPTAHARGEGPGTPLPPGRRRRRWAQGGRGAQREPWRVRTRAPYLRPCQR